MQLFYDSTNGAFEWNQTQAMKEVYPTPMVKNQRGYPRLLFAVPPPSSFYPDFDFGSPQMGHCHIMAPPRRRMEVRNHMQPHNLSVGADWLTPSLAAAGRLSAVEAGVSLLPVRARLRLLLCVAGPSSLRRIYRI